MCPSHLHALEHLAGSGASTDGAGSPGTVRLTVGSGAAAEPMTLHGSCKATPFGSSNDVDLFAFRKNVYSHCLSYGELRRVVRLDFPQVAAGAARPEVPLHWLVRPFPFVKTQLHGFITISALGFDLGDHAGTRLNERYRDNDSVLPEYLCHSYFLAKKSAKHIQFAFRTTRDKPGGIRVFGFTVLWKYRHPRAGSDGSASRWSWTWAPECQSGACGCEFQNAPASPCRRAVP